MKNYCITCILFFITFLSYSQTFDQKIEDLINENLDETIELRHWFHQNAELSNIEFQTAARIAEELKKIGYEPLTGIAKTGVVKKENASRKIARVSKKIKKINK